MALRPSCSWSGSRDIGIRVRCEAAELSDEVVERDDTPTLETFEAANVDSVHPTPVLVIAAHPELERLGERVWLPELLAGKPARLSRNSLEFAAPGSARARPLSDNSVSRTALLIHPRDDGSLLLDPGDVELMVGGSTIRQPILLSASTLARWVPVRLSSRVGLLLGLQAHSDRHHATSGLLGDSDAMQALRRTVRTLGQSSAPVLILGESGSGKELVAESIHHQSARAAARLVSVNVGALNDNTASSELFGHRRGAFTGAEAQHAGFFEQAHGGSLFLDEIADASSTVQVMLLRAIESSRISPLGSTRDRAVDVRFLAATELDIAGRIGLGRFRGSLYERLAAVVVSVPPLRDRIDDVPLLLKHFLASLDPAKSDYWFAGRAGGKHAPLSADIMFRLLAHDFPGNVRELRNIAQRLLVNGSAQAVLGELGTSLAAGRNGAVASHVALAAGLDTQHVRQVLMANDWSPAKAAKVLNVPNSTLHYWMARKGIGRRASDVSESELQVVAARVGGDVAAMAEALSVSKRGLRLRLARASTSPVLEVTPNTGRRACTHQEQE
jgi:DNA-binding NtrC family response regulator